MTYYEVGNRKFYDQITREDNMKSLLPILVLVKILLTRNLYKNEVSFDRLSTNVYQSVVMNHVPRQFLD